MYTFNLTQETLLIALFIFMIRIFSTSLDTLRLIFTRVLTIALVLSDTKNLLNVIVYAAGFATGNVIGMWIEGKLAIGFAEVRVISSQWGAAILEVLRENDYAVTEIPARGKEGMVSVITTSIRRNQIKEIEKLVRDVDEHAFITTEDVVAVQRGILRAR